MLCKQYKKNSRFDMLVKHSYGRLGQLNESPQLDNRVQKHTLFNHGRSVHNQKSSLYKYI